MIPTKSKSLTKNPSINHPTHPTSLTSFFNLKDIQSILPHDWKVSIENCKNSSALRFRRRNDKNRYGLLSAYKKILKGNHYQLASLNLLAKLCKFQLSKKKKDNRKEIELEADNLRKAIRKLVRNPQKCDNGGCSSSNGGGGSSHPKGLVRVSSFEKIGIGIVNRFLPCGWVYDLASKHYFVGKHEFGSIVSILNAFRTKIDYETNPAYLFWERIWMRFKEESWSDSLLEGQNSFLAIEAFSQEFKWLEQQGRYVRFDRLGNAKGPFVLIGDKTMAAELKPGEFQIEVDREHNGKDTKYVFEDGCVSECSYFSGVSEEVSPCCEDDLSPENAEFEDRPREIVMDEMEEEIFPVEFDKNDNQIDSPFSRIGLDCLLNVFSFLSAAELRTAALTCKLWLSVCNQRELWKTPMLNGVLIKNMSTFLKLYWRCITCLNLCGPDGVGMYPDEFIDPCHALLRCKGMYKSLKRLYIQPAPFTYVEGIFKRFQNLEVLNACYMFSSSKDISYHVFKPDGLSKMSELKELVLHSKANVTFDEFSFNTGSVALEEMKKLKSLQRLELYGFKCHIVKPLKYIDRLTSLTVLSFGPCDQLSEDFFVQLRELQNLMSLSLSHGDAYTSRQLASALPFLHNITFLYLKDFSFHHQLGVALKAHSSLRQFYISPYKECSDGEIDLSWDKDFINWIEIISTLTHVTDLQVQVLVDDEDVVGVNQNSFNELFRKCFGNNEPERQLLVEKIHLYLETLLPDTRVQFLCSQYERPSCSESGFA